MSKKKGAAGGTTVAAGLPSKKKNDEAWEFLFSKYDIVAEVDARGIFEITADQINEVREARLMTKFDHASNLPALFSTNNLAILPVTRGTYVIGRFEAYQSVNYDSTVTTRLFPANPTLETIDYTDLTSESAVLNCAYVTEILNDLAGEPVLPTVSGRMSTKSFNFQVSHPTGSHTISVNNSQCEVDGGYEGENVFLLIEAKNEQVKDFLVRQLYYPYRLWQGKIRKNVVPVFMTYSNDVFSFFKGEFQDLNDYNSFRLVEQRNYVITSESEAITLADIQHIADTVTIVPEPNAPFPQADSFTKIVDLLTLLHSGGNAPISKDFVTANYAFVERQTQYYSAGGRYLGLINDGLGSYTLTREGQELMSLPHKQKILGLVERILAHDVFNKVFHLYIQQAGTLTNADVVAIMRTSPIRNITQTTVGRRAQSVKKWIEWIADRVEE